MYQKASPIRSHISKLFFSLQKWIRESLGKDNIFSKKKALIVWWWAHFPWKQSVCQDKWYKSYWHIYPPLATFDDVWHGIRTLCYFPLTSLRKSSQWASVYSEESRKIPSQHYMTRQAVKCGKLYVNPLHTDVCGSVMFSCVPSLKKWE